LDGRRLDRSGLLVHLVHFVRESCHHHRSGPVEHLCGHLAVPCPGCNLHPAGIEAAGPGLQFAAGLLAWLVLRQLSPDAARLRYFFWLYMVFDLFISCGYVAFSGVTDFGDAAAIIAGFRPHIVWRGVLFLIGAATYSLSMRAAALELARFAGTDRDHMRLLRLVWIPYVAVGVFACCAAALNRTMPSSTVIGLAAASSLGAGLGMFRLPAMQRRVAIGAPETRIYLGWSATWVLAAAGGRCGLS
jgi:hypothetical protein